MLHMDDNNELTIDLRRLWRRRFAAVLIISLIIHRLLLLAVDFNVIDLTTLVAAAALRQ